MTVSETPHSLHLLAEDFVLVDAIRFSFLYQQMRNIQLFRILRYERLQVYDILSIKRVKSAYEPSGSSGRSLSRFQ